MSWIAWMVKAMVLISFQQLRGYKLLKKCCSHSTNNDSLYTNCANWASIHQSNQELELESIEKADDSVGVVESAPECCREIGAQVKPSLSFRLKTLVVLPVPLAPSLIGQKYGRGNRPQSRWHWCLFRQVWLKLLPLSQQLQGWNVPWGWFV